MSDKPFIPSPQQAGIFDWGSNGSGSAIVEAVAGAGKTTTLVQLLDRTTGSVAVTAYNRAIADELKAKIAPLGLGNRVRVGTAHSFGFGALMRAYPDLQNRGAVDPKKLQNIYDDMVQDGASEELRIFSTAAASMAKQTGIGALSNFSDRKVWIDMVDHYDLDQYLPEDVDFDVAMRSACKLLKTSNALIKEFIDFDDMVYGPVVAGLRMWQNDWLFLDEAQDTNATRRALCRMMLKPRGRLVAVGDPKQAIYGFTGADADSLDIIAREFRCTRLPLTVSYRCPKAVVRRAHTWVSHIEAHESAPEGVAGVMTPEEFSEVEMRPSDFVLCRNTAPLISQAFKFIRKGVACRVEGRAIGEGLIKLAGRWKVKTVGKMLERLEKWKDREVSKAIAKGKEDRADQIEDQFETMKVLADNFKLDDSVKMLQDKIASMFSDEDEDKEKARSMVTLASIHRSKGRERPRVFWLGSTVYSPSKYARKAHQLEQEWNLCYVAATRAQEELWEVV